MRYALALALCLAPLSAQADPLRELEPLLEVYRTGNNTPGWDVAGIRCAGLFYAQYAWKQDHGGTGPSKKILEKSATGLEQAVYHRVEKGYDLTRASLSVEEDLTRVIALYTDRFKKNARTGHPWQRDPDLQGDTDYCEIAL